MGITTVKLKKMPKALTSKKVNEEERGKEAFLDKQLCLDSQKEAEEY